MKIGLLLATYGDYEYLPECLAPWIKLKNDLNIKIAICHGQFKEYHDLGFEDNDYKTIDLLHGYNSIKDIDYLYIQNLDTIIHNTRFPDNQKPNIYQTEAELRNHGLKWLLKQDIDLFITIGGDEFFTEQDIKNIINQVEENDFPWYKINYKNYVGDKNHYIKGFCPARIWKAKICGGINRFYWDDDIVYNDGTDYKQLVSWIIGEEYAFVKHYSWLSNEISRNKIIYQKKRFGHCSYKWNEEKQELEIDYDFYYKNNLPYPIIYKDE